MLLGTIANDSGSVLLVIGTIYLAICAGFYWATQRENRTAERTPATIVACASR